MKNRHLSQGELFQELGALVRLAENEILRDLDLYARELGRDEGFVGPEVLSIRIQSLEKIEVGLNSARFRFRVLAPETRAKRHFPVDV